MGSHRRNKQRGLSEAQREERFDTGGLSFMDSLKRPLAGGAGDQHAENQDEGRETDE